MHRNRIQHHRFASVALLLAIFLTPVAQAARSPLASHPLVRLAQEGARSQARITRQQMKRIATDARALADADGRATPELQAALLEIERLHRKRFEPGAASEFQELVARLGAKMKGERRLPKERIPYWLKNPDPVLQGFRSHERVPEEADVVIIGAGLTGASAAYHLSGEAQAGKKIVVLEGGEVASGASGRNGGNFELMPENYFGEFGDKGRAGGYDGLLKERIKLIRDRYPELPRSQVERAARWQAETILRFSWSNIERFMELVEKEGIDCDYSPKGWLRVAGNAREERGLRAEVELARQVGSEFEVMEASEIKRRFDIDAKFAGRFTAKSGNYHPYKFTVGTLKRVLERGVELYTNTKVEAVETNAAEGAPQLVRTSLGTIAAKKVVFATNAFTSELLPELSSIRPHVSQVLNFAHVRNDLRGITATIDGGELYVNQPQGSHYVALDGTPRGILLAGGGGDRPISSPRRAIRSTQALKDTLRMADRYFPETKGQPPIRANSGPMGFTADKIPVIGFLHRDGRDNRAIVIAAGFNGYGGSASVEAGYQASHLVQKGEHSKEAPEAMYSPKRFLSKEPLPGFGVANPRDL